MAPAQLLQSFLQGTIFPPRSPAPGPSRLRTSFSWQVQGPRRAWERPQGPAGSPRPGHWEVQGARGALRRGQNPAQISLREARVQWPADVLPPLPGPVPSRGDGLALRSLLRGGRSRALGARPPACRDARRLPAPRGGPIPGSSDDCAPSSTPLAPTLALLLLPPLDKSPLLPAPLAGPLSSGPAPDTLAGGSGGRTPAPPERGRARGKGTESTP